MNIRLYIVILVFICFSSCRPALVERLITDFEQTSGDTLKDLHLTIDELVLTKIITAGDSTRILTSMAMNILRDENFNKEDVDTITAIMGAIDLVMIYLEKEVHGVKAGGINLDHFKSLLDINARIYALKMKKLQYLLGDTARVLAYCYDCSYMITNPVRNGEKQKLTGRYIIDPSVTRIIRKE